MSQGGPQAAINNYVAADDCYRESCLALAEAQAVSVRSPYNATFVEEARELLMASNQHRQTAADALTQPASDYSRLDSTEQKATAHSRMTLQLSVQALMLLKNVIEARSATQKLDFYLPLTRGQKHLQTDAAGNPSMSCTPTIFGSNRNGANPTRPHRIAMLDISLNHLAQQTRTWKFSTANVQDFCREFLENAQQGDLLDEDASNAWINRKLSQAEIKIPQLTLNR